MANNNYNEYENMTSDWQDYEDGKAYKTRIDLYNTVNKNERMYAGDQWYGVAANGLPTPVFNIFKRIINYFCAAIASQPIKLKISPFNVPDETEDEGQIEHKSIADDTTSHLAEKWESEKMDTLNIRGLLDALKTGDYILHTFWKPTMYIDGMVEGDFKVERIDNVNLFLGNPNMNKINDSGEPIQPYIMIAGREMVYKLREEAKRNSIDEIKLQGIVGDTDTQYQAGDRGKIELDSKNDKFQKTTYLLRYWVGEDGFIYFRKSVKNTVITKDTKTKNRLYPVSMMNCDERTNSAHGQALGTGLIPNQIFINKAFAMVMKHIMDSAFGKTIYDSTRIAAWNNAVGAAIGVSGPIDGVVQQLNPGTMANGILDVINMAIDLTKELTGANDSALGNVQPDNTSAIIALQKASSVPLTLPTKALWQMMEDQGYIFYDFMQANYDVPRQVSIKDKDGKTIVKPLGGNLENKRMRVKVDVGPSSQWSEITSMQTLDALLQSDKITFIQYLKRLPNDIIPDMQSLIEEVEQSLTQTPDNQIMWEQMAKFIETLPEEIQVQLQQLPPEQMEQQVKQMMMQQSQQQPQGAMV